LEGHVVVAVERGPSSASIEVSYNLPGTGKMMEVRFDESRVGVEERSGRVLPEKKVAVMKRSVTARKGRR